MSRLAIQVDLPDAPISTRSLGLQFIPINSIGRAMSVRCAVCRTWGKINPKLHKRGERVVCGPCHIAEMGEPVVGGTDPTNGTS